MNTKPQSNQALTLNSIHAKRIKAPLFNGVSELNNYLLIIHQLAQNNVLKSLQN